MDGEKKGLFKHPYIGAFLWSVSVFLVCELLGAVFVFIPYAGAFAYAIAAVSAFLFLFLFKKLYSFRFSSVMMREGKKHLFLILLLFLPVLWNLISVLIFAGGLKVPSFEFFSLSLMAGAVEETAFRIIPTAFLVMAFDFDEKKFFHIVFFTSVLFTVFHIFNLAVGATVAGTAVQLFICFCFGIFYCVIYLVTGNFLSLIAAHFLMDFVSFCSPLADSAVMVNTEIGMPEIADMLCAAVFALAAIYIFVKADKAEIVRKWKDAWGIEI